MPNDDLAQLTIDRSAPELRRRRMRPGRWAIAGVGVLALGFGGYRLVNPVPRVAVATVSRVYPSQTFTALNASGYVVAQRKAAVASKGTGRLVWLGVEEGSFVKEGQVIARLESDDLKAVTQQTRAALAAARSNRETSRAQRDAAAAARDNARAQWEGARPGLDQAKAEVDDAAVDPRPRAHALRRGHDREGRPRQRRDAAAQGRSRLRHGRARRGERPERRPGRRGLARRRGERR